MSLINIAELITDSDFTQPNGVNIIRTITTVSNHRNTEYTEKLNLPGIITIADDTSTTFLSEANRNSELIHVFTLVPLKVVGDESIEDESPGEGYLSDIVDWNGKKYEVVSSLNDEQYGFVRSTAIVMSQR